MALTISQIVAASYPAVLNKKKSANQWAENALLRAFEKQGMIKRESLGPTIEAILDYQANAGGDFLATDLTALSLSKTDILTAASYAVAELAVPIVWSQGDEAKNPSENQKIALAGARMSNAIDSHDELLEAGIFASSTDGFLGMQTICPDSGAGTPGGIDASTETFWANYSAAYDDEAGVDLDSGMTTAWNTAAKGSGSTGAPTILFSGADPHALYEGTLQTKARYMSMDEADAGFKALAFKTAPYVFSQHGGARIYFANKKNLKVVVSKEFFRHKGKEQELNDKTGSRVFIYSALQLVTDNKSRLAVLTPDV